MASCRTVEANVISAVSNASIIVVYNLLQLKMIAYFERELNLRMEVEEKIALLNQKENHARKKMLRKVQNNIEKL